LLHGKPCICSRDGAPAEIAAGGGCLPTDTRSPEPLAEAIRQLLHNPDQRHALARAAADRSPPRWSDAARKLTAWMTELSANQSTTFPFSPGNSPP
jgi:glycosyltransferase involved in cell wall biosynthesis